VRAFRAFWSACKDLFDELMLLAICNFLWALISGPLLVLSYASLSGGFVVIGCAFALLAVLPLGPATAGLASVAHRIAEGRASSWRDFFAGMRRYARPSWIVMGVWMIVLIIIVVDLIFYSNVPNTFGFTMMVFWFNMMLLWFGALIYLFPLLILQEQQNLRLLARNAFLMTMGRPVFTLITVVLMAIFTVISLILPVLPLFLTFAFFAQWSMRATLELVKDAEERRAALEEAEGRKRQPAERIPPWRR
jgi:uncharacterized membrane protein YesL